MRSLMRRFVDLETDPGGFGDPGGEPADFTALEDPGAQPDPEPVAEPAPQYLTRAELEQFLADRDAQFAYQAGYQQPAQPGYDPGQYDQYQQPVQPTLDPFADDYGNNLVQLMRQVVREETGQIRQMVEPVAQSYQDQQAQAWAEQAFSQLGVPEDPAWRDAVLAASAGYERDQFGRQVPPQVALRQGYELVRGLAEAERQKALAEHEQQQTQQTQHLRTVASAPTVPAGAGGIEGEPEPRNERDAIRQAAERVLAGQSGTAA